MGDEETFAKLKKTYDEAVKGLVGEYAGKTAEEAAKLAERLRKEKFTSSRKDAYEEPLFPEDRRGAVEEIIEAIAAARAAKAKTTPAKALDDSKAKKENK